MAFGQHRLLQHLAALLARLWELAERGRGPELQAAIAAGATFVEQTALDGGRTDVSWLLSGLAPPPAQPPTTTRSQRPGASLLPAKWLSANIAYLQDLDFLAARGRPPAAPQPAAPKQAAAAAAAASPDAAATEAPRPSPRRGARGGGKGAAAAAAAATAAPEAAA